MELYKKLHEIQKAVKGLAKDNTDGLYNYVTGNKLLSFIKPLMDEKGLILKQEVTSIDNERMDYEVWNKYDKVFKPKSEILSKVMMRFTWIDVETGEKDENMFGANGQNDWEKGLGSALTYAERYFILKYFHIATDEDDIDNPNRKPDEEKEEKTVAKEVEKEWLNHATPEWKAYLKAKTPVLNIRQKWGLSKANATKYLEELEAGNKKKPLDAKGMAYLKGDKATLKNLQDALAFRELTPEQQTEIENLLTVMAANTAINQGNAKV